MADESPNRSTQRHVLDRLTRIRAHTKALRRRLRGGSEAERVVVTGHLDAIDQEVAAILAHERQDKKESKQGS